MEQLLNRPESGNSIEALEQAFLQEIDQLEERYGKDALTYYFQNLGMFVADEFRQYNAELGNLDMTLAQTDPGVADLKLNSELRINQTYREFYESLDRTAKQLGIYDAIKEQADKVVEMSHALGGPKDAGFPERQRAQVDYQVQNLEIMKKLYAAMRAQGYTDYDITGGTRQEFINELEKKKNHGTTQQGN